jgi:hypothetical protein
MASGSPQNKKQLSEFRVDKTLVKMAPDGAYVPVALLWCSVLFSNALDLLLEIRKSQGFDPPCGYVQPSDECLRLVYSVAGDQPTAEEDDTFLEVPRFAKVDSVKNLLAPDPKNRVFIRVISSKDKPTSMAACLWFSF